MEKIGLSEVQTHLLGIAKVFDSICTKHNIPYYMIYGTMLGAIRHNGFIPWDDDMDFGVPLENYRQLEDIMERELPYPYRYCTYKNHKSVVFCYAKIEDMSTVIDDAAIDLPLEEKLGINIDIFPLNKCRIGDKRVNRIKIKTQLLGACFTNSKKHSSLFRRFLKKTLRFLIGNDPSILQKSIDKSLDFINQGDRLGYIQGAALRNTVPIEWFGKGARYMFCDTYFVGPEKFDEYLTHIYGDYKSLPPKDKRIAHVENVYLK